MSNGILLSRAISETTNPIVMFFLNNRIYKEICEEGFRCGAH